MKRLMLALLVVALAVTAGPAGAAITVSYTDGGWGPQSFPGTDANTPAPAPPADAPWGPNGYPGDTVQLQAYPGTMELYDGASYTMPINTLVWTGNYTYAGAGLESDPNAGWQELYFTFLTSQTITIGTATATLTQGGELDSLWDNDYLSLTGGPTVNLYLDGYQVAITPISLQPVGADWTGQVPSTGVAIQPNEIVMAQVNVTATPEPTTLIVWSLLGGLGLAFGYWRRKRAT